MTLSDQIFLVLPLSPERPGRTKDNHVVALEEKRLAGLGVEPQTIRPLSNLKSPKPRQLDRLATQKALGDLPNHEIKILANSLPKERHSIALGVLDVSFRFNEPPFFPVCFFGHELWTDFLPGPSICKLSAS